MNHCEIMRIKWFLLLIVCLFLSGTGCTSSSSKYTPGEFDRKIDSMYKVDTTTIKVKKEVIEEKAPVKQTKNKTVKQKSHRSSDDNLRGWDPLMEDDSDVMEINRYFENDDEEGWY